MVEMQFHCIKSFVGALGEVFSQNNHPLALYERLINKTKIAHNEAVEKHINIFRNFCIGNRDTILSRTPLFVGLIEYSQKVFIDMNIMFTLADDETKRTLWIHLLALSAMLDPQSTAKDMLVRGDVDPTPETITGEGGDEEEFLSKTLDKFVSAIDPNADNTDDVMAQMMQSGLVTELMNDVSARASSGNLDISKMLGSMQKLVNKIDPDAVNDPQFASSLGMINNMMSMMGNR